MAMIPSVAPPYGIGTARAATNLVTNGGFETNATGWTSGANITIARSTEQHLNGAASLKATVVATDAGEQNCGSVSVTLTAVQHVFSVFLYIPTEWSGGTIGVDTSGFTGTTVPAVPGVDVAADMDIREAWQRVEFPLLPDANDLTGSFRVAVTGVTEAEFFYIDCAQLETGSVATPYIETDGDTASRAGLKWVA